MMKSAGSFILMKEVLDGTLLHERKPKVMLIWKRMGMTSLPQQKAIKNVPIDEEQLEERSIIQGAFDTFKQKGYEESPGCYRVVNDNDKGYKIEYDELDGRSQEGY